VAVWFAIDIGGTKVAAAAVTPAGEILAEWREATRGESNEELSSQLQEVLSRLMEMSTVRPEEVAGVGVAIPGRVDAQANKAIGCSNLGFRNLDVNEVVKAITPAPVALANDGNAGALGEKWFGAGKGIDNFCYICVGTSVGGGLVLDGRLYMGETGRAGEVGHVVVDPRGPRCRCGTVGCLEAMVSGVGLPILAERLLGEAEVRKLGRGAQEGDGGGRLPTAQEIYRAAAAGNAAAQRVIEEAGLLHAATVVSLLRILDLRRIIYGGGITAAGALFIQAVYQGLKELGYRITQPDIVLSPLGEKAGVWGAAAVIGERLQSMKA